SCRDLFIEAHVLDRRPGQDSSIVPRNQIDMFGPENSLDLRALATQRNHLSFRGPHRRVAGNAFNLRGKRPRGDHRLSRRDLFSGCDQARAAISLAPNGLHPFRRAASSTAVVKARLSTDASSGRRTPASISLLSAGSSSRASAALSGSAASPSPLCRATIVLNSSRACVERMPFSVPLAR